LTIEKVGKKKADMKSSKPLGERGGFQNQPVTKKVGATKRGKKKKTGLRQKSGLVCGLLASRHMCLWQHTRGKIEFCTGCCRT